MQILFEKVPVRDRLVRIGILPNANSTKMKRVVRLATIVCFRITRLMNNQIKSRKNSYFPKRRESDDKNDVAIVRIVPLLGCVWQESELFGLKETDRPGETRCRKSWNQFKGYDSLGLRYVKRVSGKRKDHRLEKYVSKFLISEVPAL